MGRGKKNHDKPDEPVAGAPKPDEAKPAPKPKADAPAADAPASGDPYQGLRENVSLAFGTPPAEDAVKLVQELGIDWKPVWDLIRIAGPIVIDLIRKYGPGLVEDLKAFVAAVNAQGAKTMVPPLPPARGR